MADAFDPNTARGSRIRRGSRRSRIVVVVCCGWTATRRSSTTGPGRASTRSPSRGRPRGRCLAVEALPQPRRDAPPEDHAGTRRPGLPVETDDNVVPLDDGEADRVVMVDVLHHLYDQPEALEKSSGCSAPAGCSSSWTGATQSGRSARRSATSSAWTPCAASSPAMGLDELEAHEPGEAPAVPRGGRRAEALTTRRPRRHRRSGRAGADILRSALRLSGGGGPQPDHGEVASEVGVGGGAHVRPHAGEDGDPDLIEAHERAAADALHHDRVDVVFRQDQHGRHAAAFGVRRILKDLDVPDFAVDDVDEREAGAAAEVAGALRVETSRSFRGDGEADGGGFVGHVVVTPFRMGCRGRSPHDTGPRR